MAQEVRAYVLQQAPISNFNDHTNIRHFSKYSDHLARRTDAFWVLTITHSELQKSQMNRLLSFEICFAVWLIGKLIDYKNLIWSTLITGATKSSTLPHIYQMNLTNMMIALLCDNLHHAWLTFHKSVIISVKLSTHQRSVHLIHLEQKSRLILCSAD